MGLPSRNRLRSSALVNRELVQRKSVVLSRQSWNPGPGVGVMPKAGVGLCKQLGDPSSQQRPYYEPAIRQWRSEGPNHDEQGGAIDELGSRCLAADVCLPLGKQIETAREITPPGVDRSGVPRSASLECVFRRRFDGVDFRTTQPGTRVASSQTEPGRSWTRRHEDQALRGMGS